MYHYYYYYYIYIWLGHYAVLVGSGDATALALSCHRPMSLPARVLAAAVMYGCPPLDVCLPAAMPLLISLNAMGKNGI